MDGWSGWLTATLADKNDGWMNEGRKGGGNGDRIDFLGFEDWTGLGGITSLRVFKIFKVALRKKLKTVSKKLHCTYEELVYTYKGGVSPNKYL